MYLCHVMRMSTGCNFDGFFFSVPYNHVWSSVFVFILNLNKPWLYSLLKTIRNAIRNDHKKWLSVSRFFRCEVAFGFSSQLAAQLWSILYFCDHFLFQNYRYKFFPIYNRLSCLSCRTTLTDMSRRHVAYMFVKNAENPSLSLQF